MKRPNLIAAAILALCAVGVQAAPWTPPDRHKEIAIWPGEPPDALPAPEPESVRISNNRVAGKPITLVNSVSKPTLTIYPAKGKDSGVSVLVFPGGGYQTLAIDLEGTEVCDRLTKMGITCALLKYRVPGEGKKPKSGPFPKSPAALEDAQRALCLMRKNASEWKIDPTKIGVIGFSAGGHLVAAVSTWSDRCVYPPVDDADQESCRPDFAIALYPGHLWNLDEVKDPEFKLNPAVRVSAETPPTLIVQAEDDPVDPVENSLVYYLALKQAGVPVEIHLYAKGGHGFGLRKTENPITEWPDLLDKWLRTIGIVSR